MTVTRLYLARIRHKMDHVNKPDFMRLVCNSLAPMLSHYAKWNFYGKGHFLTRRHSVIYVRSRSREHLESECVSDKPTRHSIPHNSDL